MRIAITILSCVAAIACAGLLPAPGTGPFLPKHVPPHWELVWVP